MIFGFGKKKREEIEEEEDQEIDLVLFQGALDGSEPNLAGNARLAEAGLLPAKELITDALMRRAEELRIEPKGERGAIVRFFIDGVPYPGGRLSKQHAAAVTQILKLLSGLDIRQRTKPQKGGLKAELSEIPWHLMIESVPVKGGGEGLVVRAENQKEQLRTPDDIGLPENVRQIIRDQMASKTGVLAICGPPRSGTTSSTIGAVRCIDAYLYNIYSFVDTSKYDLYHLTEFEAREGDDLEETIRRCLRVDADVIFLGELGSAEDINTVFKSQEDVGFVGEFPARDAASGILQLAKVTGSAEKVADGLRAILSQKLIRVLCEKCREAFRPNPKMVSMMGLPPETRTLYRPPVPPDPESDEEYEPCGACGGIGYRGRTAMFELIVMTGEMKKLVASGGGVKEIKDLARQQKMVTLQREGLRLVAEGKTSLEELQRVFKGG